MVGSQYGVMGMLDLIREPRAEIAPPLCSFDPIEFSSVLEAVGVSSTSRRNWVLFMILSSRTYCTPMSLILRGCVCRLVFYITTMRDCNSEVYRHRHGLNDVRTPVDN